MSVDHLIKLLPFVLVPLTTCVVSWLLTKALIRVLPSFGMLDIPLDNRRIHTKPVPRGGGLAIALSFIGCQVIYALLCKQLKLTPHLSFSQMRQLLPLLLLLPLGLVDDRSGVLARWKFLIQALSACWAWYLGVRLDNVFAFTLPTWLSFMLTIIWITAMINAFNMIDGVDGLASGIGMISSLSLAFINLTSHRDAAMLGLLCLAGSCLGFLRFNWHPAKIFMGDTGSMFIGYMIGMYSLTTCTKLATVSSIVIPLLVCGVPFVDIILAVWRRLTRRVSEADGEAADGVIVRWVRLLGRLGHADKSHLHHRLLRYFDNNQPKTVVSIYVLGALLGIAAVVCTFIPQRLTWLVFVIALTTLSLMLHRLAVIEIWNSTELLYKNFQAPSVGLMLNILFPIWDLLAVLFGFWLVVGLKSRPPMEIAFWVAPVLLMLLLSRNYHVFWNFPSSEEYFRLVYTLAWGFAASALLASSTNVTELPLKSYFVAYCVSVVGVLGSRLLLHYLRVKLIRYRDRARLSDARPCRVVLCGIGLLGRLYMNSLHSDISQADREDVLGFVDKNRNYRHGYCYGLKVLGGLCDLEALHESVGFEKIVVTDEQLSKEDQQLLVDFGKSHNVVVTRYFSKEIPFGE